MNPEELAAVSEALEELRKGGTVSAETLTKLGGTTQDVNKVLQGYTQKLVGAASAVGGMAKQVADGEGSFKSLGGAISGLTGVVGKLASAIPLVGGAAAALAEGVGEAAKFVLDQLDALAKNYQTLGDASAGAVDGIDGLLREFNNLGNYSLPAFTKAVKANTVGLAALRGTASQGAEQLSDLAGVLTTGDMAGQFLRLGISLDAVGDTTARFVSDSARLGTLESTSREDLIKKTQAYILEVDKIARLTGKTREDQAKEAQKSLLNARFRAVLDSMTARGQVKQAQQLRMYAEGMGDAIGEVVRSAATGIPATKDVAAANIFLNDAVRENVEAIKSGRQAFDAVADTSRAASEGVSTFSDQVSFAGDSFGGIYTQASDLAKIYQRQKELIADGMSPQEAITQAQDEQRTASGELTNQFVDAQVATADASKNLQSLGFSLATAAIPAVNKFSTALDNVTGYINKNFGVGGVKTTPTGVNRGTPGGAQAIAAGQAKGSSANADAAMKFFQSAGYTKEQAAGIVGNLQVESGKDLNTGAVGDGGQARGIAQWHPDRQATFQRVMGKDLKNSTLEEQLKFIDYELKNTEKSAGDKLRQAQSAAQAARIIDNLYERSSGAALGDRMASATALAGPSGRYRSPTADVKAPTAGDDVKNQAQKTQDQQVDMFSLSSLSKQLAALNLTQQAHLAVAKKQLAKT